MIGFEAVKPEATSNRDCATANVEFRRCFHQS